MRVSFNFYYNGDGVEFNKVLLELLVKIKSSASFLLNIYFKKMYIVWIVLCKHGWQLRVNYKYEVGFHDYQTLRCAKGIY